MHKQLYKYFNHTHLLVENQYGLRPKHSTELAAMKLIDYVIELDNGNNPIGIYLDLSKAYDKINYDILLFKLKYYGIKGNALKLILNYLTDWNNSLCLIPFDQIL